ncbi:MAG: hypothetical protein V4685_19455 [Bacteroidota bacterium]
MEQHMQNNDQNNRHWKTKLEDETAFAAGELADTGVAWNKVYNRLHKPRRKKAVWYWVAAASIFTAVLFTIVFSVRQQTNNTTAISIPVQQTERQVQNESEQKALVTTLPGQSSPGKTNTKKARVNNVEYEKQTKEDIFPASIEIETVISLPAEKKEDSIKPLSTPLVSVQKKAKLKVVHVNELGDNNDDKGKKLSSDYSVIQFGVKSQPVNNNTTSPGKIGLNISTSKTSPVN